MLQSHRTATVSRCRAAGPAGVLSAFVIEPVQRSHIPPLVALHGISRNPRTLVKLFRREAARTGRVIVVPHFPASRWPVFQRPCRSARPDQALLALLAQLAQTDPAFAGRLALFGHSGGAQLAHRWAMLYPQKVARLNLAAAGWYCLPDDSMPYPYGLGHGDAPDAGHWSRRHADALNAYLALPVRVFVGTEDTARDDSLRKSDDLDDMQGRTRLARAETYVGRFHAAAVRHGIRPDIDLIRLPGVTHDVADAITSAGLARRVMDDARAATALHA